MLDDIKQCPLQEMMKDCRHGEHQNLCDFSVRAEDGFSCWTACSSMAIKRTCGDAPKGFVFEKTKETDGTECHDLFNIRDKCVLHERHVLRDTLRAKSTGCPELGSDMAWLFESVDGNRASAPDLTISANEVLNALPWLQKKGYMFLATNFSDIDSDGNHRLSWYEVEVFCGHVVDELPPTDITEVKPSELMNILHNPLLIVSLLSGLALGEFWGVLQEPTILVMNYYS